MNSLVVLEDEGWDAGVITLRGARARQLVDSHEFVVGQEIFVARLGGEKGRARVVHYTTDCVELALSQVQPSLALRPIDLLIGLSRPQTIKKVIQAAVMSGVRSLHLVHTESGEKSYLDSHLLRPEYLQTEIIKALEQTGEGLYPAIHIYRSFSELRTRALDCLGSDQPHLRMVAVPGEPLIPVSIFERRSDALVLAVGSEAGWSERELTCLRECGFVSIGLGPRVMRVELALTFLLGQSLLIPLGGEL